MSHASADQEQCEILHDQNSCMLYVFCVVLLSFYSGRYEMMRSPDKRNDGLGNKLMVYDLHLFWVGVQ